MSAATPPTEHETLQAEWEVRIVGHGQEAASKLIAHPLNYRIHSQIQKRAMEGVLDRVGWVDDVKVSKRTGVILDGHMRVSMAVERSEKFGRPVMVPVAWIDADPTEERIILASYNPLGAMAVEDDERFGQLYDTLPDSDKDVVDLLVADEEEQEQDITDLLETAAEEERRTEEQGVTPELEDDTDLPNIIFPSDNDWGVPVLRIDRQASAVNPPVVLWGSGAGARTKQMPGTWVFYTQDYRFTALLSDPRPVPRSGCRNAVEINFSVSDDLPRALALYYTFRKRYIARLWQDQGVNIFVDLNVSAEHRELNLLGVPKGWRAYATRGYNAYAEDIINQYEIARAHADTDELTLLVYGGGGQVKKLCQERGWLWVAERSDVVTSRAIADDVPDEFRDIYGVGEYDLTADA